MFQTLMLYPLSTVKAVSLFPSVEGFRDERELESISRVGRSNCATQNYQALQLINVPRTLHWAAGLHPLGYGGNENHTAKVECPPTRHGNDGDITTRHNFRINARW